MPPLPKKEQVFAIAEARFRTCQRVHDFVGDIVRPIVKRQNPSSAEEATFLGGLLRAHGWLRSLGKLNHPGDFQAVAAGARALFEIAVDQSVLLHFPTEDSEKMQAWEESSKYKAAEGLVRYFTERGEPVSSQHAAHEAFVKTAQAKVQGFRDKYWGGSHPPTRWTGRDLRSDAVRVDQKEALELTKFYDVRFRNLCWDTHGSGYVAIRTINESLFPLKTAQGFEDAAVMGVLAARQTLRLFDALDPVTEARFEQFARDSKEEEVAFLAPYLSDTFRAAAGLS